ncbi:hypothetical protein AVEN_41234-1 [Araneus ventricosus]|uniref:Integrase catalytic domain-containing protein n=1 Tax=Araneus ventricosus TaxID=182803 RepID=A0A4Y2JA22_ARAVE|nr:hypothetical protein AVEN_41234-1 [Araneus ventricosus]
MRRLSRSYPIHELKVKGIYLTDIHNNSGPIALGAEVAQKLFTGRREELKTDLIAMETKLGWALMGSYQKEVIKHSMKIRPVIDTSVKTLNHPSLNDCLETGLNLIETIPPVLARFRLHKIGVISDIKTAFLQISQNNRDRDFLRFIWFDDKGTTKAKSWITPLKNITIHRLEVMAATIGARLFDSVKRALKTNDFETILRERFWILRGKRTIRNIGKEYLICKKLKVKSLEVPFPPLPKDRTKISAVFQVMGIDLAGPLLTKSREKVWIVLFSFAFFRAVHLELIPSLNTNALIQAIRRFISRRGQISTVYSENGTNFTGLNTANN